MFGGTAVTGQHQLLSGTSQLAKKYHQMKHGDGSSGVDRRRGTSVLPDEAADLRTLGDESARALLQQDADAQASYTKLTEHDKLALFEVATDTYYAVKGVITVHTCLSEVMQMLNTKNPEQWSDVMTRFLGPMHTSSCLWYRDRSVRSDDYATSVHTLVVNPAALNTVSERNATDREPREFCYLRYSDYFELSEHSIERTLPEDVVRPTLRGVSIWESVSLLDGPKDATGSFHRSGFIVEPTHVVNTVKVSFMLTSTATAARDLSHHSSSRHMSNASYRVRTAADAFFLQRLVRSTINHFSSALMDQRIPTDRLLAKELWSDGSMCCLCLKNFTLFRHKHHCRLCGDAVCTSCSINRHRPTDRQDIRVCGACVDGNPANMIRASSKLYSQENIRAKQLLQASRNSTSALQSSRHHSEFRSVRGHSAVSSLGPRPIETKDVEDAPAVMDPLHFASQRTFVLEETTDEPVKPDFRKTKSESRLKVDHVKSDAFAFAAQQPGTPPARRHDRPYPRASFAPRGKRPEPDAPPASSSFRDHFHQHKHRSTPEPVQRAPPEHRQAPPSEHRSAPPPEHRPVPQDEPILRHQQQRMHTSAEGRHRQHTQHRSVSPTEAPMQRTSPLERRSPPDNSPAHPEPEPVPFDARHPSAYYAKQPQPFQGRQPQTTMQWNDPRPAAPSWADPLTPLDSDYITESSPLLYPLSFRNGNEWPDAPETAFEDLRLRKAHELDLLRRRDEVQRYVQLACKALACPVGAITVVGGSAGLLIAKVGVGADTMPRHIMLESHAITSRSPLIVLDCRDDLRFMANPLVSHGEVGIRFYVGLPLCTSDGCVIGVLSLVDTTARSRVRKSDLQAAMQVATTVMRRFEDMALHDEGQYHPHARGYGRPASPDLDLD
ncbi:hypothetical protein SDRG_10737 [Saprolegnia diclina VS20]|uniref:FYVE-type domain-containing protein n=1 Tax=Saprolegnia diclina (strain VS20) TaxID=1156394 RepID=T0QDC8_SAPDV|nr:hypothetical protein SDRG_10737 [Saprolegnia diclina VS20]EQC31565.1 hypothetical protein SDRG_10737 [Saprolegnia diclina VS20]|eukprot:XP_008614964.1 hypothetical protein SDRG_10737 [Saprolegnia diclina VS20]